LKTTIRSARILPPFVAQAFELGCDILQGYLFAKPGPPFLSQPGEGRVRVLVMTDRRRKQRRFPLALEIALHGQAQFWVGTTKDIAEGGVFVATRELRP